MAKKTRPRANAPRDTQRQQAQGRLTKAQRKDQARLERQAILEQMARRKRNSKVAAGSLAVLGIALAIFLITRPGGSPTVPHPSASPPPYRALPGEITSTDTSTWTNNLTDLEQRLAILQLGTLNETVLHIHAHLDLYVNGQAVPVPADIGLPTNQSQPASPLHVHVGEPGVIHIESADPNAQYFLGQFFDVWGLRLNSTCLGGYCNNKGSTLTAYVNGTQRSGDPRDIPLTQHEEIVVAYGTKSQLPNPIPSSFDFSQYGL